jgi:hypothetical protein
MGLLTYNSLKLWFSQRENDLFLVKRILTWGLGIALGLFLLNLLYGRYVTATVLNCYEETFQGLEHPNSTTHFGAFKFKFWYYPATYRDESIQDRCVYLVGEIRTFANDWDAIKEFYEGKRLAHGDSEEIYVGIIPIELIDKEKFSPLVSSDSRFSYSPFDVDVLEKLRSHYSFWGTPDGFSESGKDVYVVYIAPKCD